MKFQRLPLKQADKETAEGSNPVSLAVTWLGQAGFLIVAGGSGILIDPYLSDYLAKKYAGTEFPHIRMMPPPAYPDKLRGISAYLCTHAHSDHMDPETLGPVMRTNRGCRAVVPAAWTETAVSRGAPANRVLSLDAGAALTIPDTNITIEALPAAHETLDMDDRGRYLYLGYLISAGGCRIYHSGDCIPYPGLQDKLKELQPDIALLPVNGRDEYRRSRGIAGNFTPAEAAELCIAAAIPCLIVHHFGMFDFNTTYPGEIEREIAGIRSGPNRGLPEVLIPEAGKEMDFIRTE